jgi:hypothetical protein
MSLAKEQRSKKKLKARITLKKTKLAKFSKNELDQALSVLISEK